MKYFLLLSMLYFSFLPLSAKRKINMDCVEINFMNQDSIRIDEMCNSALCIYRVKGRSDENTFYISFKQSAFRKLNNKLKIPDNIAILKCNEKTWRVNKKQDYPYRELVPLELYEN